MNKIFVYWGYNSTKFQYHLTEDRITTLCGIETSHPAVAPLGKGGGIRCEECKEALKQKRHKDSLDAILGINQHEVHCLKDPSTSIIVDF